MTKAKQPVPEPTTKEAPERIWINNPSEIAEHNQNWWYENPMAFPTTEYIRADLSAQSPEPPSADAEAVAIPKLMTDAEWASLSAESRFRINAYFSASGDAASAAQQITSTILPGSEKSMTVKELNCAIAAALTTAQAKQREVDAGIAETKAGRRCLRHQQSGKGVCGYEIADAIRAGGKQ